MLSEKYPEHPLLMRANKQRVFSDIQQAEYKLGTSAEVYKLPGAVAGSLPGSLVDAY